MLEIQNLSKRYGKFLALDNLSLSIEDGAIFGFVGPNGAGKTTTMRILATLMKPTEGTAAINGIDINQDPLTIRKQIGYMPDFFGVYDRLRVTEYLEFYGRAAGMTLAQIQKAAAEFLELVDLTEKRDNYVDSLSRGMKQRLCLARCLLHNPSLLILDEPASGMDPRARLDMMSILRQLKDMGKTILISSHILHELSELCDVIGIMEHGKLLMEGDVKTILAHASGSDLLEIKLADQIERTVSVLKEQTGVKGITMEGQTLCVEGELSDERMIQLLKTLVAADLPIISFARVSGKLEQVFLEVTVDEQT